MGVQMSDAPMETDAKDPSQAKATKKYFIDATFIHRPREGVEMRNPMRDCTGMTNSARVINITSAMYALLLGICVATNLFLLLRSL